MEARELPDSITKLKYKNKSISQLNWLPWGQELLPLDILDLAFCLLIWLLIYSFCNELVSIRCFSTFCKPVHKIIKPQVFVGNWRNSNFITKYWSPWYLNYWLTVTSWLENLSEWIYLWSLTLTVRVQIN